MQVLENASTSTENVSKNVSKKLDIFALTKKTNMENASTNLQGWKMQVQKMRVRVCKYFLVEITDGKMSSNSFTWVTEGGDLGTADWGCLAGRCASLCLQAAHGGRAAGGSG